MRIDSSLPMQIARAYGVTATRPASGARPAEQTSPVRAVRSVDAYEPTGRTTSISQLLAGKVSQAVDFDTSTLPRPGPAEPFQLYTRAADKIEAAVAVQVGRALDVRG
jgi:hypothetical protein